MTSDPPGHTPDRGDADMDTSPANEEEALEALRSLLLAPERERLEEVQQRLEDPNVRAKDIGRVLPEAIVMETARSHRLATALAPTVEEILRASVKRDIRVFVDALFPVMGPAIRKSISEAFRQMVQSLNQAMERSFSWEGLKWRMESIRTGKPFAEVVLLNSLVYRVEQVFLIHRETGLLLQHVSEMDGAFQDADLVSGMLTAIQDFVRDSFSAGDHESLQTIQLGDVTVWIEQGPSAIIAGAIRGNAPEDLRTAFQDAIENIHLEKGEALQIFEGDAAEFEAVRHHLESCLISRYR